MFHKKRLLNVYLFIVGVFFQEVLGAPSTANSNSMTMMSPCPNIFQYYWDGDEWYGIIIAPSLPYGTPARLVARLSIGTVLPTKYAGILELIGPRSEVLQSMLREQPIRYKVYFPLPHPIPSITSITLNDRLICTGPTVSGPIVTSITLEHTLYPRGQTLNSRSPMIPPNPGNNPGIIPEEIPEKVAPSSNSHTNNIRDIQKNIPAFNGTLIEKNILSDICGNPVSITPLIANGVVSKEGSHPWLVALFTQKTLGLEFTCAGTLISNRIVLTAAHCIRYGENRAVTPDELVIYLGKHFIKKWTEPGIIVRDALDITLHPEYRALSGDADLAVIRLKIPVIYTEKIRPVCLPSIETPPASEGVIIGWGRDETGLKITPEPRKVHIKIVSQEECLRSRLEFRYITSNRTLCAGGVLPDSGPCSGDSGGGLFQMDPGTGKWILYGVISMSLADPVTKSCDLGNFSVFVDVRKFMDWILSFM